MFVACTHCGKIIERTRDIGIIACFDCKKKRHKGYYPKYKKIKKNK